MIIPTLNEENVIRSCLDNVDSASHDVEIIVADGGSTDRTIDIAKEQNAIVCNSETGRGLQCNTGAAAASREILVFLHADTRLPKNAFTKLAEIFKNERVNIGTFFVSFDINHWLLRFFQLLSRFDPGLFRFGDQCLVIRKSFFDSLGGFSDYKLFEDIDLVRRARKLTKIHRFPMTVTTSSRRFLQNGVIEQQMLNVWYILQYFFGVPPERLAKKYERNNRRIKSTSLILFVRFPHPDKVKTRLAMSIGREMAQKFYKLCAENLFHEIGLLACNIRRYIFYADKSDEYHVKRWAGPQFRFSNQVEGTLGKRIISAFDTVFGEGSEKAIIVASDVPDLSVEIINEAISALDYHDIVIGPTYDGGYYLLGMKGSHKKLFRGISWSTEKVYRETLSNAATLGLSVHYLPYLFDIDTEEDLGSWMVSVTNPNHPVLRSLKDVHYSSVL